MKRRPVNAALLPTLVEDATSCTANETELLAQVVSKSLSQPTLGEYRQRRGEGFVV